MNVNQLKKVLNICIKKNATPFLWGQHGIGKSQIIKQYCDENKLGFIDLRLGQVEAGDLIGMPERDGNKTVWLMPSWFPEDGQGILFLDEVNRARPDVLQAIFQLVLDRRLFTHELPDNWKIVCAGNPPIDDYNVVELDKALMNRFIHIILDNDVNSWMSWADGKIHNDIIKFINIHDGMLSYKMNSYDDRIKVLPTPRGWEIFSKFVDEISDDDLLVEVGKGIIGIEAVTAFIKQRKSNFNLIDEKEIINNFSKVKPLIENMIINKTENDVLFKINNKLLNHIGTKYDSLQKVHIMNLLSYVELIPADLSKTFMFNLKEDYRACFLMIMRECQKDTSDLGLSERIEGLYKKFSTIKALEEK